MQALSKRWAGMVVLATWIVATAAGGLLDQEGLHRASRFLAGAGAGAAGSALLLDSQGVSREAAPYNAGCWSRWHVFSMGWQRTERWQFRFLRIFGAFAALVGATLFLSGFAWNS
jgi:hypothetical protein